MATTTQLVGHVLVETGEVAIVDPGFVDEVERARSECGEVDRPLGKSLALQNGAEFGVVSATAMGDGLYPVFAILKDGNLVGLTVDFDLGLGNIADYFPSN